jgi:hypothetical protein
MSHVIATQPVYWCAECCLAMVSERTYRKYPPVLLFLLLCVVTEHAWTCLTRLINVKFLFKIWESSNQLPCSKAWIKKEVCLYFESKCYNSYVMQETLSRKEKKSLQQAIHLSVSLRFDRIIEERLELLQWTREAWKEGRVTLPIYWGSQTCVCRED